MIFLEDEQNSQAWLESRWGRFTASEFGKFVMRQNATAIKAFENNLRAKLGEEYDGNDSPPSYEDYWMKRGKMLESSALAAYQQHTGHVVEKVGLAIHETLPLGFSADAMVDDRSFGLELKCPSGKIQIQRIDEGILPEDYVCQVHGSMFLMDVGHWDFFSWHPRLPAFYIRVFRDSFTEELGAGIMEFGRQLAERKEKLAALIAA